MGRDHIQGPSGHILEVLPDGYLKGMDELIAAVGGAISRTATGGSTTSVEDTNKNWEADIWKGSILDVTVEGSRYFRKITGNTADTLNFTDTLDDAVSEGDEYTVIPWSDVVEVSNLQHDDETLKTIVDAVEALIDQMPLKTIVDPNDGGNVLAMVDVAPWAIERVTGAKTVIKSDHAAIHEGEGYVSSLMLPGVAADSDVEIVIETGSTKYVHLKDYEAWTEGAKATLMLFEGAIHDGYDFGPQRSTSVNRNRLEDMPESEVTVTKSPTNLLFLDADITGVDTTDKEFVIAGDHEDKFSVGSKIYIHNSTGNDGPYTVVSATHDVGGETTTIVVEEEIVNSTADGALYNANLLEVIKFGSGGEVTEGATGQGGGSSGQGGNKTLDIEWVLKQDTSYLLKITNEWSESADISVWLYWYEEEEA